MSNLHLYLTDKSYRDVTETPSATITSLPTPVHSSYRHPPSFADVVRMPRRPQQSTNFSPNCLIMSLQATSPLSQSMSDDDVSLDGLGLGLAAANRFFRIDDEMVTTTDAPEEAENRSFSPMPSNDGQRKKCSYADAVRGTFSPASKQTTTLAAMPSTSKPTTTLAAAPSSPTPDAPLLKDSLSSFGGDGLSRGTFGDLGSGYDSDNNNNKNNGAALFIHPEIIHEERPLTPGSLRSIFDEDPRSAPIVPRDIHAWRRDVVVLNPPPLLVRPRLPSAGASKRPRSITEDDDNTRPRTRPQLSAGAHSAPDVVQSAPLSKKYLF